MNKFLLLAPIACAAAMPPCLAANPLPDEPQASPLRILNTDLPAALVNTPYPAAGAQLVAKGGAPPYSFTLAGGGLPAGMTLQPGGLIEGVPSDVGNFTLTLRVTDSLNASVNKSLTLRVVAGAAPATWTPRGLAGGPVTAAHFSPNYATDDTLFVVGTRGDLFRSTDRGAGFTRSLVEPAHAERDITQLLLSPVYDQNGAGADAQTLFAFSTAIGVYRSVNRGASFAAANNGLPCFETTCLPAEYPPLGGRLAISPNYAVDHTLWLALYEGTYYTRVYRSTNGGGSWSYLATPIPFYSEPLSLQVSPAFPADNQLLLTLSNGRTYLSFSGGAAWAEIFPGPYSSYAADARFSPAYATDNTLLVYDGYQVYRSVDGGETFILAASFGVRNIAPASTSAGVPLWYFIPWSYPLDGRYNAHRTDDSFATQVPLLTLDLPADYTLRTSAPPSGVAVSPPRGDGSHDLAWFSQHAGLYLSSDEGLSFTRRGQRLASQRQFALAGEGADLIAGGEYGWYLSTDGGRNWTQRFEVGYDYLYAAISPARPLAMRAPRAAAALADKTLFLSLGGGYFYYSRDAGRSFAASEGSLGGSIYAVDFERPWTGAGSRMLVATSGGLHESVNDGSSFAPVTIAEPACTSALYSSAQGISIRGTTWFATFFGDGYTYGGVCKSVDGGATWTRHLVGGQLRVGTIVASPGYSEGGVNGTPAKTVLLSTYAHDTDYAAETWRSTDGGLTWNPVTGLPAKTTGVPVFSPNFAIDNTVFLVPGAPGFLRSAIPAYLRMAGLWRSSDGGASFAPLGAGDGLKTRRVTGLSLLPNFNGGGIWRSEDGGRSFGPVDGYKFVSDLVNVMAARAGELFVGTGDQGIFRSSDGGQTYSAYNAGLPAAADIRALHLPEAGGPRLCAVAGLGLWSDSSGWQPVSGADGGTFTSIRADGFDLYASRTDGLSLRSGDGGFTWQPLSAGETDLTAIEVSEDGMPALRGAGRAPETSAGLWAVSAAGGPRWSLDSGATWTGAPGGNDYTVPTAAFNWRIVKPLGLNPAGGQREVVAAGQGGLWRSTTGGQLWRRADGPGSGLEATSRNYSTLLSTLTPSGTTDVLVGVTGATTGGVYLSADSGEHWIQVNQGFDPNNLSISSLAKTSCPGCPVQYYSGSYGGGVYTRTIGVLPAPAIAGWNFGNAAGACGTATPSGPVSGGQPFKLCGGNFQAGLVVEFDGVPASGCVQSGGTVITCTATPPHSAGLARARVRNPDTRVGALAQAYQFSGGVSRTGNSLRLSKSGADAALTWQCTPVGCAAATPSRVYRAQNAAMVLHFEPFNGGVAAPSGALNDVGVIANPNSYFWVVE